MRSAIPACRFVHRRCLGVGSRLCVAQQGSRRPRRRHEGHTERSSSATASSLHGRARRAGPPAGSAYRGCVGPLAGRRTVGIGESQAMEARLRAERGWTVGGRSPRQLVARAVASSPGRWPRLLPAAAPTVAAASACRRERQEAPLSGGTCGDRGRRPRRQSGGTPGGTDVGGHAVSRGVLSEGRRSPETHPRQLPLWGAWTLDIPSQPTKRMTPDSIRMMSSVHASCWCTKRQGLCPTTVQRIHRRPRSKSLP